MSRTSTRIAVGVILTFVVLLIAARLRYAGKATVKLPAANCNADLWKHVYSPQRLAVIEPCTAVEGRVVSVHRAADGDLHIGFDPEQQSTLNLVNAMHAQRHLIAEVVCDHSPRDEVATGACRGYTSQITAPGVGDHVRITGSYVTDRDNGWNEIHPVSRIDSIQ